MHYNDNCKNDAAVDDDNTKYFLCFMRPIFVCVPISVFLYNTCLCQSSVFLQPTMEDVSKYIEADIFASAMSAIDS